MSSEVLPESVRRLLRDRLKGFEQLEVLLLLHRFPDRRWTAPATSAEVHLAAELVADALGALMKYGLVEGDGIEYCYGPADPTIASAVEDLALACRERRVAVMSQLSRNAIERIRSGSVQTFADAFVLGKRKHDGSDSTFRLADLDAFLNENLLLLHTAALTAVVVLCGLLQEQL
jgi:hypothetical protein